MERINDHETRNTIDSYRLHDCTTSPLSNCVGFVNNNFIIIIIQPSTVYCISLSLGKLGYIHDIIIIMLV